MGVGWRLLKLWVSGVVALMTLAVACGTNAATPPQVPAATTVVTAALVHTNSVDIWVDPLHGSDNNKGATRDDALATLSAAWARIPRGTPLQAHGFRILLAPGAYPENTFPHYWEERYGTSAAPIEITAADGPGTVQLGGYLNFFDVDHLRLVNLHVANEGDVFHCEQCTHLTLQGLRLDGGERQAHETVKINQSQYITITGSDIFGSYENAIDFVAVQYGVISDNRLHDADDWCIYLKGGSAYFRIERNVIYNCGTGGFTAGQGTGFEFMTAPWLHYEAYDIKFVNNIVHDTDGAGMGVNGGYNILLAHNTLYRVGARSHVIEVVYGLRSCDGNSAACAERLAQGGWGTTNQTEESIPNRNVFIYNNVIYNPPGYQSAWQHFAIHGPRTPGPDSNIPAPLVTDENLQIRGNWIWNGSVDHALGIDEHTGCASSNPTCNAPQVWAENSINVVAPGFVDAPSGNYRLAEGTSIVATSVIPPFGVWTPPVAGGVLSNDVQRDFANQPRSDGDVPGAFSGVNRTVDDPDEEPEEVTFWLYMPGVAN